MIRYAAESTIQDVDGIIKANIRSNLRNVADEVSLSIDQQLRIIAESVCMVSALYTKKLIDSGISTNTSKHDTIFRHHWESW